MSNLQRLVQSVQWLLQQHPQKFCHDSSERLPVVYARCIISKWTNIIPKGILTDSRLWRWFCIWVSNLFDKPRSNNQAPQLQRSIHHGVFASAWIESAALCLQSVLIHQLQHPQPVLQHQWLHYSFQPKARDCRMLLELCTCLTLSTSHKDFLLYIESTMSVENSLFDVVC